MGPLMLSATTGTGSYVKVTAVAGAPTSATAKTYELLTGDLDFSNLVMAANEVQGKEYEDRWNGIYDRQQHDHENSLPHTLRTGFYALRSTHPLSQASR